MNAINLVRAGVFALLAATSLAVAAPPPKVAVTDLAYEERVSEYFRVVAANAKSSLRASGRESERESDYGYARRSSGSLNAKSESSYYEAEGTYSYIERGELRKFTADIKGEMLKSGRFQLVQGKPFTDSKHVERLYDVIARVRQGMYPGADYVLFGSINSMEFRQEANPIDHTNTVSHTLSLELVAEFSLISTRDYKIKAAFSAMGTGQDVKLMTSRGGRVVLNRGKVVSEVSKSLGEDVARQFDEQLGGIRGDDSRSDGSYRTREESNREEVIIFR
ncbi:MAG: penicillin-binding protein activator LpoB [Candidatus Accumulibacter sp.]|nr:penicillin-binding protein activator LpoB [Accumulibacter sp.]